MKKKKINNIFKQLSLSFLIISVIILLTSFRERGINNFNMKYIIPDTPSICLVTVDTSIVKNVVVWKKIAGQNIKYYKIYKESTVLNHWDSIGYRPFDSLSYFIDSQSFPKIKTAKYRLSAVDSSGNESALSPYHRTINLNINKTTGNWSFDLMWTPYVGFNVDYYLIWRWSLISGWVKIDSVQGGIQTYSDTPPYGLVYYFVEAKPPHPCQVTKAQTNYNTSRSNRANTSVYLGLEPVTGECRIAVFPNPSSGKVNVAVEDAGAEFLSYELFSSQGKVIERSSGLGFTTGICGFELNINDNTLSKGLYFLRIIIDNKIYTKKIIIN
jgi:hypothetical protein